MVFWGLSTPGDGDHLEKPSVVSFESTTSAVGAGRGQQVVTRWFDGQDKNKQALFRGLFCGRILQQKSVVHAHELMIAGVF